MLSTLAKLFGFKKTEPTQGEEAKPVVQEVVEPAPVVAAAPAKPKRPRKPAQAKATTATAIKKTKPKTSKK